MSKLAKYLLAALVVIVAVSILWYFGNIVTYILISAVLAIVGKPLVNQLLRIRIKRWSMPRWLAALVSLLIIWGIFLLFATLFIPLVANKIYDIANMDTQFIANAFEGPIQSIQEFLGRFTAVQTNNFSFVEEINKSLMDFFNFNKINAAVSSAVSIVSGTVVALFSITFITYFFLKEENLFVNMVVAVFPRKYENNIKHAMDSANHLLMRYFTGILAESTIIMLLLASAFMLWGFTAETAFFMGMVMGVLNVIPYIGPLIGTGICLAMGIISPLYGMTFWNMIFIVAGTIVCVKGLDDFVLQPTLYSNRVKAHPLEIFIVILMAGSIGGIIGMLIAIPTYTVVRVFAKEFFNKFYVVQKLTERI